MKLLINCLLASLVFASHAFSQSSSVQYGAAALQRTVNLLNGTPVANGNRVWIGSFDSTFTLAGNEDDPAALFAAWNPFGSTPSANIVTLGPPFNQAGSFSANSSSTDAQFNNQRIYLWMFSTTGAAAPNTANWGNVQQYGLFSSTITEWNFLPVGGAPPNQRQINTDQINEALYGSIVGNQLRLNTVNPVPEPSILGLLGLAIPTLILTLRRRRTR